MTMQNNWRNIVKERFKNRKIEPKHNLWKELEKQLDQHNTKPTRRIRSSYLVVASMVLLIGVSVFVFRQVSQRSTPHSAIVHRFDSEQEVQLFSKTKDSIQSIDVITPAKQKELPVEEVKCSSNTKGVLHQTKSASEVDKYVEEIFKDISVEKIMTQVEREIELEQRIETIYNAMGFREISVEELLQIASVEAKMEQYVENKLNREGKLSETEKNSFKERVYSFFEKISDEYDKLKVAFVE